MFVDKIKDANFLIKFKERTRLEQTNHLSSSEVGVLFCILISTCCFLLENLLKSRS